MIKARMTCTRGHEGRRQEQEMKKRHQKNTAKAPCYEDFGNFQALQQYYNVSKCLPTPFHIQLNELLFNLIQFNQIQFNSYKFIYAFI